VGDVVLLDETKDVGATNRRQLAALYCGSTAGYEVHSFHCTQFCYHVE
jgi:phenylalanyl-tRNA synthetase beta chain